MAEAKDVCVGVIVGAHGVRGLVKVKSFTTPASACTQYGPLSDKAGRGFSLKALSVQGDIMLAEIDTIKDRNDAEKLKGTMLYASRTQLSTTKEEEFYHSDLQGLAVRNVTGMEIGIVKSVHNYGASDILEIEKDGRSFMVPFTQTMVPLVNVAEGYLVIDVAEDSK